MTGGTGALRFVVRGIPTPQGSKRGFVVNGRAVIVDDNKKPLRTWRQDVKTAAVAAQPDWTTVEFPDGPIRLYLAFHMPRPKWHYGTGRNAGQLKPHAPIWCDKKPDEDKLARAVQDALTAAGVYRDDAQVAELTVVKKYAGGHAAELDTPGAVITIAPLVEHAPETVLAWEAT